MSQFFDQASTVLVPSGYREGKLYSQKPLSTDGELTFTRATSATRVGPDGLIEKVRTNLVLQSETFDNASWVKTQDGQVTITANAAVAPNGTTTAEKMIPSAIAGFHCVQQVVTLSAGEASVSVYAKAVENSFLQIFDALTVEFVNFNLTTGAVGSSSVYVGSIEDAGNGWYRCKATKVVPSGNFTPRIAVVTSATAVRGESFTGNGTDGLLIWGAQAETGVATDYIATTTAAVSVGPVANLPRLDYLGSSCPRLLLEPQRTNTLTYSEAFDNVAWTKGNATISANTSATLDPSGYNGADKLQEDSSTDSHFFGSDTASASSAEVVTYSIFLKAAERSFAALRLYTGSGSIFGYYNLANGTLGTIGAGGTGTIVSYGNGWYRCSLTITMASSSVTLPYVFTSTGDGVNSYTGTTGSGIYCFGAQQEIGAYATSYIPTLGAAVTRGFEDLRKTGISSLIGQTEGVWYLDFTFINNGATYQAFQLSDGTPSNFVYMYRSGTANFSFFVNATSIGTFAGTNNTRYKIAFAYKAGQHAIYINGAQVFTSASGTAPTALSQLNADYLAIGAERLQSPIHQILLFKTRLSNADLATLTTI
jgi:hypothetical protein